MLQGIVENILSNISSCLRIIAILEDFAFANKDQDFVKNINTLGSQYRIFYQNAIDDVFRFLNKEIIDLNSSFKDIENLKLHISSVPDSSTTPAFQDLTKYLESLDNLVREIVNYNSPISKGDLENVKNAIFIFEIDRIY